MENMTGTSRPRLYSSTFLIFACANFFTVSSFGSFFIFPLFITAHGGTNADIGIIMGVFALASVCCRPWISQMIDSTGRRKSFFYGSFIMGLMPLSYLFFKGNIENFYIFLIVMRIIHGVGLAICFTAAFTYVADILPRSRLNEGIGMFGATGLAGLALGPVVGELVAKRFGFIPFFISGSALAWCGFFLNFFVPESYVSKGDKADQSFFSILVRQRIALITLVAFLFGFGLAASGNFVPPFATEVGIRFISLYYICYSFAAIATRLAGGRLADRIGENRIIPWALMLAGSGLLMIIFLRGNLILVISGLMSGCGHGFLFPCLNALIIRDEPQNVRGKITGIFTGGIDAGAFTGSIILGYMGQVAGFRSLFLTAGLALFIGLWIYEKQLANEKGAVATE